MTTRCLSRLIGSVAWYILLPAIWFQVSAEVPKEAIRLWPQGAPGDEGIQLGEEKDLSKVNDQLIAGKPVIRLGNVAQPTMLISKPPVSRDTKTTVLVCPGGGYHILAMDLEGTEVVEWLNSIGITGVLLKYRVPARKDRPRFEAPLQDAQRAMSLLRANAEAWGLDSSKIGVLGFSAGGHLSATLSTRFDQRAYAPLDAADRQSIRPDFAVLVYPGYLAPDKAATKVSPELAVSPRTPPTFLVQTQDDFIPVESTLLYYLALRNHNVQSELHLFATGGHGYGLRPSKLAVTGWPSLVERWLSGLNFIDSPAK